MGSDSSKSVVHLPRQTVAPDDLTNRLLKRGGKASAAELDKLAKELTQAKLSEFNDAMRRATIDRPVKVMTLVENQPVPPRVKGYITQERFILDRTPREIREILGLRSIDLLTGARVLGISQQLQLSDFENKGYTYLPAGQVWTPTSSYPPGRGAGQWNLLHEVTAVLIQDMQPGERYRRGAQPQRASN
jgi:hypothetical protein